MAPVTARSMARRCARRHTRAWYSPLGCAWCHPGAATEALEAVPPLGIAAPAPKRSTTQPIPASRAGRYKYLYLSIFFISSSASPTFKICILYLRRLRKRSCAMTALPRAPALTKPRTPRLGHRPRPGPGRTGHHGRARQHRDKCGQNRARTVGHYLMGRTLGEGSFGKVRLGTHILTGEKVAVKILEKSRLVEAADVQRVAREINGAVLSNQPTSPMAKPGRETRFRISAILQSWKFI